MGTTTKKKRIQHILQSVRIDDFAVISKEAIAVLDFREKVIVYNSNHGLLSLGSDIITFDEFSGLVHPEDRDICIDILKAIESCFRQPDFNPEEVNYFAFTYRIRDIYSQNRKHPRYIMIYQKIRPTLIVDSRLESALCLYSISVVKEAGNLKLYHRDGKIFEEYSFRIREWIKRDLSLQLTTRQKWMLLLAHEGKSHKEIAAAVSITMATFKKEAAAIREIMGVRSLVEALVFATNHNLIFHSKLPHPGSLRRTSANKRRKRLTPALLELIQAGLDNGRSVNSLAAEVRFSEAALRRAIKDGRLRSAELAPMNQGFQPT
jgi:DNA-binding CsgD family transcriptional regulator